MKVQFVYMICALIAMATVHAYAEPETGETEKQMMDLKLLMEDIEKSDITEYKSGDRFLFKLKNGDSEKWLNFEKGELNLLDSAKGKENESSLLDSQGIDGSAEIQEGANGLKVKCGGSSLALNIAESIQSTDQNNKIRNWLKNRVKEKKALKPGFNLRAAREINGKTYFFGFQGVKSIVYRFDHKTGKVDSEKVTDVEKTTSGKYIVETDAGKMVFKKGEVTDANGITINKKLTDARGMKNLSSFLNRKKPGLCGRKQANSRGRGTSGATGRAKSFGRSTESSTPTPSPSDLETH